MIALVRHGESVSNVGGATWDDAKVALTPRGLEQAERFATTFPGRPSRVVSSPFARAIETARPFLALRPGSVLETVPVQEFTYLSPERCRGTSPNDRRPWVEAYWERMAPDHREGPGAESFADFVGRVQDFLAMAKSWEEDAIVFGHEQFFRGVVLATVAGGLAPTVEHMRVFHALRSTFSVPNALWLALERRGGRWWVGGPEG